MIRWLVHLGLGRLAAWMVRKGWLTAPEAARAEAALETLVEIGEAAAKQPARPPPPAPQKPADLAAAAQQIAQSRDRSEPTADDLNAAEVKRHGG